MVAAVRRRHDKKNIDKAVSVRIAGYHGQVVPAYHSETNPAKTYKSFKNQ